ncbi:efflux RND transporter periplasmic adaptor subunit [Methyloligella sp. 2.7D]|uniref:efflux RND transporter periplasmic adaptor subunit n=1 Tax=unclassified Methyloligella TaxID=2625955 RepID=UPI00157CC449|nr:efflux RND transporter periplasmic adaptor subunit [Methyloligella sp. GL2]QKP77401.1 efflux RND transporter periplasmic adaptor subunit [Methyloligella sp. GL2]
MIKRLVIVALIFGILLGGLAYFQFVFKPQMIEKFVAQMQGTAPVVTSDIAREEDWTAKVQAIGTVTATKGVNLAPEIAGIVAEYFFETGDDVKEGTKLVQLDDSVQQAELHSNLATLKQTKLDFDRQSNLVKKGAVSQSSLDSATAARDTAAAAVEQVEAVIAQKKVLAPFSGRLGLRKVERGQYVSAGEGLVWIQALDPIWVDFPVPEKQAGQIKVGDPVTVTSDAFPDKSFDGKVLALDVRVNEETRTLTIRAEFPNPDKLLLPGMFGNVAVSSGKPQPYVTVPRTAVTYGLYGDSVWVAKKREDAADASGPDSAKADETAEADKSDTVKADAAGAGGEAPAGPVLMAERRFVRVGPAEQDRVAILEGIEAGEEVITSGQLKLDPDGPVKIDNSERLKTPAELPRP